MSTNFTPNTRWLVLEGEQELGMVLAPDYPGGGFVALTPEGYWGGRSSVGTYRTRDAAEVGLRNVFAPETLKRRSVA